MKLVKMMPFLDQESKDDFVQQLVSGEIKLENRECVALYPFLSKENLNALIKAHIEGTLNVSVVAMMPFLDEGSINDVSQAVVDGKIQDIDMDMLLPFLPHEAIRKLFEAELRKKQE